MKYRVEYINNGPEANDGTFEKPWHCVSPDGTVVGRYSTEDRADRERFARNIIAEGQKRRAADLARKAGGAA